ncbi:gamma-glutamyltransferase family protein [Palleronia sp. KMU-117]|uniref:gamma-glutamyltransferase family protein n=1 Tax=Palleronia sp. KMU-117 TaxID=3434108 RepID=UPI003D749CF3
MRDFHLPGRSPVLATNAMAATSHPLATLVAVETLKAGGNAMDAAIAAALLQGIAEPQMTGIGGDCFVLFTPPGEERVLAMNGSGRAPAALNAEAIRAAGHSRMPEGGAVPVTIPGAIDAFCRLLDDWGRLGRDRVFAPVIRYAEDGIPIAPRVAFDLAEDSEVLVGRARDLFLNAGRPFAVGEVFRAPGQAEVLRRVAAHGAPAFYEGEVADDMVASLRAHGGVHTAEDFAATACDYTEPVSGDYRGVDLVEHPPNGQGATAILMAKILSHFDLAAMDPFGPARAHLEAEAAKLAYDARNRFIADPDHTTRLAHMLAPETAARLAGLISPTRVIADPRAVTETVHKDTIYLTVVDADGMKVSLIYSIYSGFGSGVASKKFGILFQNRGAGFTLEPGHPNEAGGGKRPMHTIIPAMLREGGRVTLPFGVMGGGYQPNGHARVLTNLVDYGLDLQTAIDAPRSFWSDGQLALERGYRPEVRQALSDLGHKVVTPETPIGGAQAIRIDHDRGVLEGASDPRKDGLALGY